MHVVESISHKSTIKLIHLREIIFIVMIIPSITELNFISNFRFEKIEFFGMKSPF